MKLPGFHWNRPPDEGRVLGLSPWGLELLA
jgi:hypothetical protein